MPAMAETIPNRLVVLTFDDGHHTRSHPDVASLDRDELIAELDHIDRCCRDFGIPRPRTFCYPGYHTSRAAVAVLAERGYAWACCGCEPTPHDPRIDHPLLVPTSAAFGAATPPSRCATWAATCRRRQRPPIPTRPGAAGTAPVSDHRTSGNSR